MAASHPKPGGTPPHRRPDPPALGGPAPATSPTKAQVRAPKAPLHAPTTHHIFVEAPMYPQWGARRGDRAPGRSRPVAGWPVRATDGGCLYVACLPARPGSRPRPGGPAGSGRPGGAGTGDRDRPGKDPGGRGQGAECLQQQAERLLECPVRGLDRVARPKAVPLPPASRDRTGTPLAGPGVPGTRRDQPGRFRNYRSGTFRASGPGDRAGPG